MWQDLPLPGGVGGGKKVKCNACGHVFLVTAPATPPAEDSSKKTPKSTVPEAIPVAQLVSVTPLAAIAATAARR